MRYTLRQLECFSALAEKLHFGLAAQKINITQPALSRQISALEDGLDLQLVVRESGNVRLTPAGIAFLDGCHEVFDVLQSTQRRAHLVSNGAEGVIRVGYTDFAISSCLPDLFAAYRKAYPGVALEPFQGSTMGLIDRLAGNHLDVIFGTGPIVHSDISTAPFITNRLVAILYDGHPLTKKERLSLVDFNGEDLVLGLERFWRHYLSHLKRALTDAGISYNVVERGYNSEGLFGIVAAQSGISIYPDCALNYIRRGLVIREIDDLTLRIPTETAWSKNSDSPVAAQFVRFAQDWSANLRPSDAE